MDETTTKHTQVRTPRRQIYKCTDQRVSRWEINGSVGGKSLDHEHAVIISSSVLHKAQPRSDQTEQLLTIINLELILQIYDR